MGRSVVMAPPRCRAPSLGRITIGGRATAAWPWLLGGGGNGLLGLGPNQGEKHGVQVAHGVLQSLNRLSE